MTPPSLSERIERSPVGQVLIASAIVLVLLAEVAIHLPAGSAVRQSVGPRANEFVRYIAAEQQWGVFAPDPRQISLRIEGRVTFEDGSTDVWELPEGPRVGANLRYYRWRKWLERVRSDEHRGLWEPTARWIASLYEGGPSPVARVQLVRMTHRNVIEGAQPPYEESVYYTYTPQADEAAG